MTGPPRQRQEQRRRSDIQGVRAVAVLAVIAFHAYGWPRGGFLGVDAFFVVSGYLITGLLLRERARSGRTSLAAFWARRARRILPLALLVLAAVVAAASWVYAAPRAADVRTDAWWAAAFAANWRFAAEAGDYFAAGETPSPLLHFWSLGVEEQFYLVWPWLVVLVATTVGLVARRSVGGRHRSAAGGTVRRERAAIGVLALAVGLASAAWATARTGVEPAAYYSSLTRAWEIAAGAALATLPALPLSAPTRTALSWVGLGSLLTTLALTPSTAGMPWPGAVGAVVATATVLVAGHGGEPRRAYVLANPVSRYVGDISYGLYLWHFPLVVMAPAVLALSPSATTAVALAATLALAVVSHHLVERPILEAPRRTAPRATWATWWRRHRRGMAAAAAAALAIAVAGTATAATRPELFTGSSTAVDADLGAVADPGAGTPTTPVPTSTTTTAPPTPTPTATLTPTPSPTATAWAPIPLGRTGERLQEGLRAALASRSWPASLNPKPDRWESTKDGRAALAGCVATDADDPTSCTLGRAKGPEIVVYGDSLGIPLLSAVEAAYGKTHRIRGLTKLACAVNGVDADFGRDEWAIPCVNHREMTIDYVKRTRPEVLIMVENYAWMLKLKSDASGSTAAKEWLAADQEFVDAVKDHVGHVVVLGPSMPGVGFLDCYRSGGSPGRCVTGIPSWWERARDAERRIEGATFVDTTHWYCVDGRCPIFTATTGTVLKGDYLHMTVQYARQLGPDLAYLLDASGVIPAP